MKTAIVVLALVALSAAAPAEEVVQIISQESDIHPDGHYSHSFEASNGIRASENGELRTIGDAAAIVAEGAFEFVGDNGENFAVSYIADENGYQPQGAHLPTPPPVPEAIVRALAYLATAPPPKDETH